MQSVRSIPRRLGRPSSRRQFDSWTAYPSSGRPPVCLMTIVLRTPGLGSDASGQPCASRRSRSTLRLRAWRVGPWPP